MATLPATLHWPLKSTILFVDSIIHIVAAVTDPVILVVVVAVVIVGVIMTCFWFVVVCCLFDVGICSLVCHL